MFRLFFYGFDCFCDSGYSFYGSDYLLRFRVFLYGSGLRFRFLFNGFDYYFTVLAIFITVSGFFLRFRFFYGFDI